MKQSTSPSQVYFLPWDRREELTSLLEAAGAKQLFQPDDYVALKMHFGERGNDGFIRPEYVRPVIKWMRKLKASVFLTDTNTIYNGPRNNAIGHLMVAAEHGFHQTKLQTPVIIADGLRGADYEEVEVQGEHFSRVKIASAIREADLLMVLSHFKGHLLAGFGGAVKNLGMGCGSRGGKFEMHSTVSPSIDVAICTRCGACLAACAHGAITVAEAGAAIDAERCVGCGECMVACPHGAIGLELSEGGESCQERFAEYAIGAVQGKRAFYLNFINHVTSNCDCMSRGEESLVPDIGILASQDPVAIDQASLDLVVKAGGDVFQQVHPQVDGTVQLAHAEKMGLGLRNYELIAV